MNNLNRIAPGENLKPKKKDRRSSILKKRLPLINVNEELRDGTIPSSKRRVSFNHHVGIKEYHPGEVADLSGQERVATVPDHEEVEKRRSTCPPWMQVPPPAPDHQVDDVVASTPMSQHQRRPRMSAAFSRLSIIPSEQNGPNVCTESFASPMILEGDSVSRTKGTQQSVPLNEDCTVSVFIGEEDMQMTCSSSEQKAPDRIDSEGGEFSVYEDHSSQISIQPTTPDMHQVVSTIANTAVDMSLDLSCTNRSLEPHLTVIDVPPVSHVSASSDLSITCNSLVQNNPTDFDPNQVDQTEKPDDTKSQVLTSGLCLSSKPDSPASLLPSKRSCPASNDSQELIPSKEPCKNAMHSTRSQSCRDTTDCNMSITCMNSQPNSTHSLTQDNQSHQVETSLVNHLAESSNAEETLKVSSVLPLPSTEATYPASENCSMWGTDSHENSLCVPSNGPSQVTGVDLANQLSAVVPSLPPLTFSVSEKSCAPSHLSSSQKVSNNLAVEKQPLMTAVPKLGLDRKSRFRSKKQTKQQRRLAVPHSLAAGKLSSLVSTSLCSSAMQTSPDVDFCGQVSRILSSSSKKLPSTNDSIHQSEKQMKAFQEPNSVKSVETAGQTSPDVEFSAPVSQMPSSSSKKLPSTNDSIHQSEKAFQEPNSVKSVETAGQTYPDVGPAPVSQMPSSSSKKLPSTNDSIHQSEKQMKAFQEPNSVKSVETAGQTSPDVEFSAPVSQMPSSSSKKLPSTNDSIHQSEKQMKAFQEPNSVKSVETAGQTSSDVEFSAPVSQMPSSSSKKLPSTNDSIHQSEKQMKAFQEPNSVKSVETAGQTSSDVEFSAPVNRISSSQSKKLPSTNNSIHQSEKHEKVFQESNSVKSVETVMDAYPAEDERMKVPPQENEKILQKSRKEPAEDSSENQEGKQEKSNDTIEVCEQEQIQQCMESSQEEHFVNEHLEETQRHCSDTLSDFATERLLSNEMYTIRDKLDRTLQSPKTDGKQGNLRRQRKALPIRTHPEDQEKTEPKELPLNEVSQKMTPLSLRKNMKVQGSNITLACENNSTQIEMHVPSDASSLPVIAVLSFQAPSTENLPSSPSSPNLESSESQGRSSSRCSLNKTYNVSPDNSQFATNSASVEGLCVPDEDCDGQSHGFAGGLSSIPEASQCQMDETASIGDHPDRGTDFLQQSEISLVDVSTCSDDESDEHTENTEVVDDMNTTLQSQSWAEKTLEHSPLPPAMQSDETTASKPPVHLSCNSTFGTKKLLDQKNKLMHQISSQYGDVSLNKLSVMDASTVSIQTGASSPNEEHNTPISAFLSQRYSQSILATPPTEFPTFILSPNTTIALREESYDYGKDSYQSYEHLTMETAPEYFEIDRDAIKKLPKIEALSILITIYQDLSRVLALEEQQVVSVSHKTNILTGTLGLTLNNLRRLYPLMKYEENFCGHAFPSQLEKKIQCLTASFKVSEESSTFKWILKKSVEVRLLSSHVDKIMTRAAQKYRWKLHKWSPNKMCLYFFTPVVGVSMKLTPLRGAGVVKAKVEVQIPEGKGDTAARKYCQPLHSELQGSLPVVIAQVLLDFAEKHKLAQATL